MPFGLSFLRPQQRPAYDLGLPTVPVTELTFDGGYIYGGD
jgi:hypothetical protein